MFTLPAVLKTREYLGYLADIPIAALNAGIDDITRLFDTLFLPVHWRYHRFYKRKDG